MSEQDERDKFIPFDQSTLTDSELESLWADRLYDFFIWLRGSGREAEEMHLSDLGDAFHNVPHAIFRKDWKCLDWIYMTKFSYIYETHGSLPFNR
jgi:hypothetical protein